MEIKFPGKKRHVTLEWPLGDSSLFLPKQRRGHRSVSQIVPNISHNINIEDHTDTRLFFLEKYLICTHVCKRGPV